MEPLTPATLSDFATLLRPHQWTKNAFCIAGVIFSGRLVEPGAVKSALFIFVLFCAASSSMYITNDIVDRERDKLHPKKRLRSIPSGAISLNCARLLAFVLAAGVIAGGLALPVPAFICLLVYFILNLIYSLGGKHQAVLDVGFIALGFVLRLLSGVYVVHELPTTWITLCTFFLALFLGFSKRRAELHELLHLNGSTQRPVLAKYNLSFLDSSVSSAATMTILSYALFTVSSGKNPALVLTVPIVYYGVSHYKMVVMVHAGAQEPERIVLKDIKIQVSVLLWLGLYLWITHSNVRLFH